MNLPPDRTASLLRATRAGDDSAAAGLTALLYDELHALAVRCMRRERADHTLQATALVNDAYLRLVDQHSLSSLERGAFLSLAAETMRRVLVDHARASAREKRGGSHQRVTLNESIALTGGPALGVLDLETLLQQLAVLEPRHAKMVELRVYGGLTDQDSAEVLGVSRSTVEKDWRWIRAWLSKRLNA